MTGPRIGSLFSGYGGLEQGVQAVLGGSTAWVSDIDKGACKILAHRYPDVPNLGDVTAVDWSQVEPVDVLTGGFPCQDVSHAGKRAGLRPDTRTGLWSQMAYAIDQLRPALVVAENVRGLLSAEAHSDLEPCPWCMGDGPTGSPLRALGAVLGDLADIGYDASWYGLRAADVGAPHGRFRVFVVAYPARDELRVGYRDGVPPLPTPAVNDMGAAYTPDEWDAWTDRMKAEHGNGNGHGKSLSIEAARLLPTPKATNNENRQSLDRYGMNLGQALGITALELEDDDADTTEDGPGEVLRDVRFADDPQEVRDAAGGQDTLPGAPELLAELWQHEDDGDEGCSALASPKAQGADVPGLRGDEAAARSPRGPQPSQQRPEQPHDALRVLSPDAALAGGSPCPYGCGKACGGHSAGPWGEYEAAIRRWEVCLGRPSPDATRLSAKGNAQLSAQSVEFLMGLPTGWVTDVPGITRNEALKALGNGVVPQQAEAALRLLLSVQAVAA